MARRLTMAAAALMAAVASSAAAQTAAVQPVEVELHVHRGRLFVPIEADDSTSMEFLLGTGWPTGLTASTATRLGDDPELTLGGIAIPPDELSTYPDSMLTIDGTTLAGVVGPNTLSRFDVLIDVPGGRLVLKPTARVVEWEGMTLSEPIDLRIMHGVEVWLSVELDGNAYQAILDLGTPTVVANQRVQADTGLDDDDRTTLRFGDTTLTDGPVFMRELDLGGFIVGSGGFVIIGAPIVYDCALALSWAHQEMRMCVR